MVLEYAQGPDQDDQHDAARLPGRSGRRFAGPRSGEIIQQGEADQHRTYTTSTESPREKEADAEDHRSVEGDRLGEPRGIPPRSGEPNPGEEQDRAGPQPADDSDEPRRDRLSSRHAVEEPTVL